MKFFRLLFIVLLFLQFSSNAQSDWFQQTSGTTEDLHSIFFTNEDVGWAVGEDSTILHTLNAGLDWIPQPSGFSGYQNYYNDVFFVNDTLGWVVGGLGYGGVILHTSDGGNNWIKQSETTRRLNTVYFINDTVG